MSIRFFGTWVLAAWLGGTVAGTAEAQSPAAGPKKVYTNRMSFQLPVRVDDRDRTALKELKFFVRPPGGEWQCRESAPASQNRFAFQTTQDGEYWFCFVTVDQQGRQDPAQPDLAPPKLIVVVDTKPPEVTVKPLKVGSGETYLQCVMKDENPDSTSARIEYEAGNKSFKPLDPIGNEMNGVFRMPNPRVLEGRVRVTAADKAGNSTTREIDLGQRAAAAPVSDGAPMPTVPTAPVRPAEDIVNAEPPVVTPRVTEKVNPSEPGSADVSRQLMNTRRCSLEYAVDGLSPGSIQSVEAFVTRDNGVTWQKVGADGDKVSPIELDMPGDGFYGVVVVVGTVGVPAAPPGAGEKPDWWVEIDTSKPVIELHSAKTGAGDDAGLLLLHWAVQDAGLKPDCVALSWGSQPDGPWHPIAQGLKTDGQYRWPIAKEAGAKAYLKIEARDWAGNVGQYVTPKPVVLEIVRPKARVLGINPAAVKQ